jgi:hypothetical protein
MSALGQKRTFAPQKAVSALPPKADICSAPAHVRFGPKADICNAPPHVRFTPESDIKCDIWAKRRHQSSAWLCSTAAPKRKKSIVAWPKILSNLRLGLDYTE